MSKAFRSELIQAVSPEGRDGYASALHEVGEVVGREGVIQGIALRVIKGIQRLKLDAAILTTEGLMTPDQQIIDCSAAMVRKKKDGTWERYVGKTSAHPTRIQTSYNPSNQKFSLSSSGEHGEEQNFDTSLLLPREGARISAKFGGDMLEGVLENGPISDHLRQCLAGFEEDLESIGLILRHPGFVRYSDTRTQPVPGIQTLYTDGSQLHVMNERTVLERQNATCPRPMSLDHYRAGIEIGGEGMLPNTEDVIGRIIVHSSNGDVPLDFTALTPRCLTPQRDLVDGKVNAEPKLWLKKNQPLRPWDTVATLGANVDMPPEFDGAMICVGDRFTVQSEKDQWRQ